MRKRIITMLVGAALLCTSPIGISATPADAAPDAPVSVQAPDAPTHNETTLSLFSCAATRSGTGHANMTVNHSHRIAAESVSNIFGPRIDAFDCEGYDNPGLDGCVWRTYYVYDNKLNGSDLGIVGPVSITCFGFDGLQSRQSLGSPQSLQMRSVSASRPLAYNTPLPAYDVCGINMPHIGSDYLLEYYKSTVGDPHYSCIAAHGYEPNRTEHYYIVCHDSNSNAWWWKPGVGAWLSGDCD